MSRPGTPTDGINLAFLSQALIPYATQIALAAGLAGKLNTSGGSVSGLLSFSGTDTPGLQLKVLTASQITALGEIGNGSMLLDSTNNEVDVRINGVTQALISNRGGQTINGALAITGVLDLRKGAAANVLQFSNTAFLRTDTSQLSIFDTGIGRSNIALWRGGNFVVGSTTLIAASSGADATGNVVDTSFSRNTAGVWQMGTTASNALGSLLLTNLTASGIVSTPEQNFTNGSDFTRISRAPGTNGRLRIFRPNSTGAMAVQFGGGNDEMFIGQGGEGSFRVAGGVFQVGSVGTLSIDSATNLFQFRGASSTVMATLTGTGDLATVGTITYSSIAFPELVTNGGFDTDTAWAKGAGWTISGGVAVATGVVSFADINQNLPAVEFGRTYIISFTMTRTAGTSLQVYLGNSGSSWGSLGTFFSSGTYSIMFHKGPTDTAKTLLFRGGSDFTGTIDNVSVRRAF